MGRRTARGSFRASSALLGRNLTGRARRRMGAAPMVRRNHAL